MLSISRAYAAIVRGALALALFLVPVTVLPWASEPLEIHKQTLLIVTVVVASLGWLGTVVVNRALTVQRRVLLTVPFLVALFGLFSSGLSDSPYLSIIGQAKQEYTSLLSWVIFGLLAFLFAHSAREPQGSRTWVMPVLLSGGVVAVHVAITMLFGNVAVDAATLVGTPNAGAIFLLTTSLCGCALWLTSRKDIDDDVLPAGVWGAIARVSVVVSSLVTLWLLLALDYGVLWVVTLVAVGAMLAFAFVRAHDFPHIGRFLLPIVLFVSALVFLVLPSPFANVFPSEVAMSAKGTWGVVREALGAHGVLFGSGAGTFMFQYDAFHDPAIAETDFWSYSFDRGSSHVLTMLATFGVVGTLLQMLFMIGVGAVCITALARERHHAAWKHLFAPSIAWLVLATAQWLYPSNVTLSTLYWAFSGVILAHTAVRSWEWTFARSPRAALASAFLFVLMIVGLAMALFVGTSRYIADVAYARAIATDRAQGKLTDILFDLDRAALRNRWSDIYYRSLAHALLLQTSEIVDDPAADTSTVKALMAASINAALRATSLAPANPMNWNVQGDVYREVGPLVEGADDFAIAAYAEAVRRSPADPRHYVDLARAYLVKADKALIVINGDDKALAAAAETTRGDALAAAYTQLANAVSLRDAYAPAHFYMAYVLERQGKVTDAITRMEYVKTTDPYDVGVALQLGLLYLKQGKSAQAKTELLRALELAPTYANARWYLASIYEEEGDFDAAIAEIETILENDAENATVQKRLQDLRDGLTASQLPDPIEEIDASLPTTETVQ